MSVVVGDTVCDTDIDRVSVGVSVTVFVCERESLPVREGDGVGVGIGVIVCEGVGVTLREREGVSESDEERVFESDQVNEGERVRVTVTEEVRAGVRVSVTVGVSVTVKDSECDGVRVRVTVCVRVLEGDRVSDTVAVCERESDRDLLTTVSEAVCEGVSDDVADAVSVEATASIWTVTVVDRRGIEPKSSATVTSTTSVSTSLTTPTTLRSVVCTADSVPVEVTMDDSAFTPTLIWKVAGDRALTVRAYCKEEGGVTSGSLSETMPSQMDLALTLLSRGFMRGSLTTGASATAATVRLMVDDVEYEGPGPKLLLSVHLTSTARGEAVLKLAGKVRTKPPLGPANVEDMVLRLLV